MERVVYEMFSGMTLANFRELDALCRAVAPIRDDLSNYIAIGDQYVWDMQTASYTTEIPSEDCVFYSPFVPNETHADLAQEYLLQVANGEPSVREDIIQSMAPLVLAKRPTGVIWWQGVGANGKSSTMDLLYRLFPEQLADLTVHAIEDERDAPMLNGKLGNIVRESSEGRINDSRTYKSLGTHEPFYVHKFHSQDSIQITGDLHHIFSTNNMPAFDDKSQGARRRTIIIQFKNKFDPDPTFEERTFTKEFLEGLMYVLLKGAEQMKKQDYKYRWSEITTADKQAYDDVVNTAEAYVKHLVDEYNVQWFKDYHALRQGYENWCQESGFVALGVSALRRAAESFDFVRSSRRGANGKPEPVFKRGTTVNTVVGPFDGWGIYVLDTIEGVEAEESNQQLGLDNLGGLINE